MHHPALDFYTRRHLFYYGVVGLYEASRTNHGLKKNGSLLIVKQDDNLKSTTIRILVFSQAQIPGKLTPEFENNPRHGLPDNVQLLRGTWYLVFYYTIFVSRFKMFIAGWSATSSYIQESQMGPQAPRSQATTTTCYVFRWAPTVRFALARRGTVRE